MRLLSVKEFYQKYQDMAEQCVVVSGWVKTKRIGKEIGFVELGDGTCMKSIQVVLEVGKQQEKAFGVGACLMVKGTLKLTPEAKQPFEITAEEVTVMGDAEADYPLQKKRHSNEYLRTIPHLRPRTNLFSAIFRMRSVVTHAITDFLYREGFTQIHTPCMTSCDGEGAGEVFRLKTEEFFGKETYLTVTGQLHVEPFAQALRRVFTFGPSFRAEDSNTPRHAAEFWQVEPEMAFCDLQELTEVIEALCKHIFRFCLTEAREELEFFERFIEPGLIEKLERDIELDFARVSYHDAVKLLMESGEKFQIPASYDTPIQTEHERYLAGVVFGKPVFVTDYPKEQKAFYMYLNDDEKTVAATDLLFPKLGEIVGASQREDRLAVLQKRIEECGLKQEDYAWYCDLRRYGSCTHSGFGLGVERMLRYITGVENIRDVIAYPRTPNNIIF
ncbi:MAG: asparagine--tRNA ligase [Lachnospiraceae bacterium]|nr:asparagine--tRNA ligase [Lachnospiraceae bacterium]